MWMTLIWFWWVEPVRTIQTGVSTLQTNSPLLRDQDERNRWWQHQRRNQRENRAMISRFFMHPYFIVSKHAKKFNIPIFLTEIWKSRLLFCLVRSKSIKMRSGRSIHTNSKNIFFQFLLPGHHNPYIWLLRNYNLHWFLWHSSWWFPHLRTDKLLFCMFWKVVINDTV